MKQSRVSRSALSGLLGGLALALSLLAGPALAQYPTKPVRLIVPFPPGGATDSAARELGEGLSKLLGQSVLVENRPGADGTMAAQAALGAPGDGYTLLFASSSMEGIPFTQKASPFKSLNDFTAVSLVCRLAFGMVINSSVPARSVQELVTYAKAHPDQLNYGSGSLSEVMAAGQFMKATGTRMVRINYKGGAQIVPDLANGQVQVSFGPLTPMLPFVRDRRMSVLAVFLDQRASVVPDAPSLKEIGITSATGAGGLQAVMAPPGVSSEVVERLGTAIRTVMSNPGVREKFTRRGQEPETSTPEALAAMIRSERAAWERFAAEEGITPE